MNAKQIAMLLGMLCMQFASEVFGSSYVRGLSSQGIEPAKNAYIIQSDQDAHPYDPDNYIVIVGKNPPRFKYGVCYTRAIYYVVYKNRFEASETYDGADQIVFYDTKEAECQRDLRSPHFLADKLSIVRARKILDLLPSLNVQSSSLICQSAIERIKDGRLAIRSISSSVSASIVETADFEAEKRGFTLRLEIPYSRKDPNFSSAMASCPEF